MRDPVAAGRRTPSARKRCSSARRRASAIGSDLGLRVPALGEVPELLPAAPADDRDLAVEVQQLEQLPDVPGAVPAVVAAALAPNGPRARARAAARAARARAARSAGTRRSRAGTPARAAARRSASTRRCSRIRAAQHRQRLDRPEERVPLDQRPLDPEQPVELARGRTRRGGSRARGARGRATVAIGSSWRKPSRRTVSSTPDAEPSSSCARTAIRRACSVLTVRIPASSTTIGRRRRRRYFGSASSL